MRRQLHRSERSHQQRRGGKETDLETQGQADGQADTYQTGDDPGVDTAKTEDLELRLGAVDVGGQQREAQPERERARPTRPDEPERRKAPVTEHQQVVHERVETDR